MGGRLARSYSVSKVPSYDSRTGLDTTTPFQIDIFWPRVARPFSGLQSFCSPQILGFHLTKVGPHKKLTLIAYGQVDF
jgi:hypothetical protein